MPRSKTYQADLTSQHWNRNAEQFPIQKIEEEGCYVDTRHGYLYRVTPEMLNIGGTVFMGFTSDEPWLVTKISEDPNMPLDECRIVAANYSLHVAF